MPVGLSPDGNTRPMPDTGVVPVLYIAGYSRSGSTLLDLMVGQLPGFFSTGELGYIWSHGLVENRLCGCGRQFLDCGFWQRVGDRAFGGWDEVDAGEFIRLERNVNRHRYLPLLIRPDLSPGFRARLHEYADILSRLYGAIAAEANASVIVDSTIDPAYGFLLARVPGLDTRVVHFVRDSRATAFSWRRWQRRTDRVDTVMYQRRISPAATAVRWSAYHLAVHLLARQRGQEMRIRYEDVLRSPSEHLWRLAAHAGKPVESTDLAFVSQSETELAENHTVAGSLVRHRQGSVSLRLDNEWERALRARDRRVVTALSWALLRHYGYVDRKSPPTTSPR